MFRSCLPHLGPSAPGYSAVTDVEIYFGTMFGSAERYARTLAYDVSTQRRVRVTVHDLDGFDQATFARKDRLQPTRMFVFVVSTHFAGAPPPSAERFRNWINELVANPFSDATTPGTPSVSTASPGQRLDTLVNSWSSRRKHPLAGMQFAVFGIGDSVYLTYNAASKFIDLKLKHLGATRVCPIGLGDCSNDIDATFKAWEATMMRKLPLRMSTTHPLGLNFVSAYSTISTGRRLATTSFPVVPVTILPVPNDQKQLRIKTRVTPEQQPQNQPLDPMPGTPVPTSRLFVRDNFGRTVRLRFVCDIIDDCKREHLIRTTVRTPAPPGPRTPRVALFDTKPFADIEVVECVGDNPSSSSGPSTPSSSSSRRTARQPYPATRAATFRVRLLNPEITYTTVSTLAIFPQNSADDVEQVALAFGYDLDAVIHLRVDDSDDASISDALPRQQELPFPTPCTIRTALTEFLELRTVTRELLHVASGFVVTTDEHDLLENLSSTDGASAFKAQISDQRKGLVDILDIAPTLQIPFEVFVSVVQSIRPRYYTIASSPRVLPRDIEMAVSLGRVGKPQGFAVSFLETVIAANKRVPFRGFVSYSRFAFQDDYTSPMIFITMGVGVSAMRAMIVNRLVWLFQNQTDSGGGGGGMAALPASIPKHILFVGAANEEMLVYRDDLRHWEQQLFVKVHYAFSNEPRYPRQYVQDVVADRMDEIYQAVKQSNGSRIFVCGRAPMVRRLREIFEADQTRRGNAWFDAIHSSGRFIDEAFN